jgi:hypothetical protein
MIHVTKKDLMPYTIEDNNFGGLRVTEDRLPRDFSFNVKFKLAKGCDEVEHTGTIVAYDFSPSYLFAIIKVDQETWYPDNIVSISVDDIDYYMV